MSSHSNEWTTVPAVGEVTGGIRHNATYEYEPADCADRLQGTMIATCRINSILVLLDQWMLISVYLQDAVLHTDIGMG